MDGEENAPPLRRRGELHLAAADEYPRLARAVDSMIEEQLDLLCRKLDQVLARGADLAPPGADQPAVGARGLPASAGPTRADKLPVPPTAGLADDALKNFLQLLRQKLDDLRQDQRELSVAIGCLGETVDARVGALVERLRGGATGFTSAAPGGTGVSPVLAGGAPGASAAATRADKLPAGDWQRAILGRELAEQPGLEAERQQLLAGLLRGEPAACGLAGQLLVFQSASVEKMPPLLKDVGEAFYRWQPKTHVQPSVLEQALVRSLQRTCEAAGISNTIELVGPGERFDSTRHNASMRGVEITEIHGWVVLRDNGKVYTKAAVSVK